MSFQTRLTLVLLAAAVIPLGLFGVLLIVTGTVDPEVGGRLLLFAFAVAVVVGVVTGAAVGLDLVRPVRELSAAVSRVAAGDMSKPIPVVGTDVIAQLAESHNRLADDAARRNRQLADILTAVEAAEPRDGVDVLADRAARDAESAFGFIAAVLLLVNPDSVPPEERIPGVSVPIRAEVRAGDERLGLLLASLPATRTWERADQALLDLFAIEVGVAIRNAELFEQVQAQNAQLRTLGEIKDDFLRGVSHNLQTPLTRIHANAEALAKANSIADPSAGVDPRLTIISEQADRLSRMVQQLLIVTRLDSQSLRPHADVLAIGPRVQRAWDALAVPDRGCELHDSSAGWLAVADADQLDQVLWALLDNAVKYGKGAVQVEIGVVEEVVGGGAVAGRSLWTTISDGGPGLADADRDWLFGRFARGAAGRATGDGSGLGLYVSRALVQGMGGDLVLDPTTPGRGATFRLTLPAEPAGEG